MAYRVNITPRAERDLTQLYLTINAAHSSQALAWFIGLRVAIRSLATHPKRCPKKPGNSALRCLLYGRKPHVYRVTYRVVEKQRCVNVLHIRHGAQRLRAKRLDN